MVKSTPASELTTISSISVLQHSLAGTVLAVWAFLTNVMDPRVINLFYEPMLICLTLMSIALQSQDGAERVFKASKIYRAAEHRLSAFPNVIRGSTEAISW